MAEKKTSERRMKYIDEWQKEHQDKILLRLPKGEKAVLQCYTKTLNTSMNNFINNAIYNYMGVLRNDMDEEMTKRLDDEINKLRKDSKN